MELAWGKTSLACSRYLWPSVRSTMATPMTPSRPRSTSTMDFSSFVQRTCCFSLGGAAEVCEDAARQRQSKAKVSPTAIDLQDIGLRGSGLRDMNSRAMNSLDMDQILASRNRRTQERADRQAPKLRHLPSPLQFHSRVFLLSS